MVPAYVTVESDEALVPPREHMLIKAIVLGHLHLQISILLVSRKAGGAEDPARLEYNDVAKIAALTQDWVDRWAFPRELGVRVRCAPLS